jgi:hypothetical protein
MPIQQVAIFLMQVWRVIDKDDCKNKTLHGGVFKHKEKKKKTLQY